MTDYFNRRRACSLSLLLLTALLLFAFLNSALVVFVTAWKRNIALLSVMPSVPSTMTPLSARDLLGIQTRGPSHGVMAVTSILSIPPIHAHSTGRADSQAPVLALLLLGGHTQLALAEDRTSSSDQLSRYLVAIAHGLAGDEETVEAYLRNNPRGLDYLRNAAHVAWDNRVDPDSELAIAAGEMFRRVNEHTNSNASDIYRILSYAYERVGNRSRAIELAELWVKVAPEDCDSTAWLTALYLRSHDSALALRLLKNSLSFQMCLAYPRKMGQALDQSGDLAGAISFYRQSVRLQPEDAYAQWDLGQALYRAGQTEEAIPYLEFARTSPYLELQQAATQVLEAIQGSQQDNP